MTIQDVTNGTNGFRSEPDSDSASTNSSDGSANGVGTKGTDSTRLNHRRKMSRKQSSPMMPAFMVSAPGKVIVFGEHAVVHGKVSALSRKRSSIGERKG